jgi:hypothetical protein
MITVVSGMARSGTSLTMQMLNAASVPVYWDREPNYGPANPRGYFEVTGRDWREYPDMEVLLGKMEGKVTKVFPRNWDYFTDNHQYQIIYLDRNPVNIRDSQRRMLELEERKNEKGDPEEHLRGIIAYRGRALKILKEYRHVIVQYEDLYNGRAQWSIGKFLNLNTDQLRSMLDCVDVSLHHFTPEEK